MSLPVLTLVLIAVVAVGFFLSELWGEIATVALIVSALIEWL